MPSSNYEINTILNYNFGGGIWNPVVPYLWFGLSTSLIDADDDGSTATEPSATSYARTAYDNIYTVNITGMSYTGKTVTLTTDSNPILLNDSITVAGVNTGFTVTNIDWNWICTDVGEFFVTFDVEFQPIGATPQTIRVGTVQCTSWTTSTLAALHNNNTVSFNPSGAGDPWSTTGIPILSVFVSDDGDTAAGNILAFYTLPLPLVVPELTTVSFPVGAIHITQPTTSATLVRINDILNYAWGSKPYSPDDSGSIYFGLSTSIVTDAGLSTVTEPLPASGYARITRANDGTTWTVSSGSTPGLSNVPAIAFPASSASWGIINSLFIADSDTVGAGNILWYSTLVPGIIVQGGTSAVTFDTGEITVTMT